MQGTRRAVWISYLLGLSVGSVLISWAVLGPPPRQQYRVSSTPASGWQPDPHCARRPKNAASHGSPTVPSRAMS